MGESKLDCRNMSTREAGLSILRAYNDSESGSAISVILSEAGAGLRMWLIEAGVKHRLEQRDDDSWRLAARRGLSPGQGTVPGLHHVAVADSGSLWACERATRLARFDSETGSLTAVAAVATKASHLVIDPDEEWIYVADPGANALLAVASNDLSVQHIWPAPGAPQLPQVTANGIVCVTGGGTGTLTIVRKTRGSYDVRTIGVGACPHDPLLSPDGKEVFVPCAGDGTIVRVDLEAARITARYPVGDGPSHLVFHPDGSRLYSANTFDGTVSCISVEGDVLGQEASGPWAHQPEISPDGESLYVANFLDDTVSVFETERLQKVGTLDTESYPHGLGISSDGRWLIATGFSSDRIRVYDAVTHIELARIDVGRGSSHIAFLPGEATAYIACSVDGHLARIDLNALICTARVGLT